MFAYLFYDRFVLMVSQSLVLFYLVPPVIDFAVKLYTCTTYRVQNTGTDLCNIL